MLKIVFKMVFLQMAIPCITSANEATCSLDALVRNSALENLHRKL